MAVYMKVICDLSLVVCDLYNFLHQINAHEKAGFFAPGYENVFR
ncbi:Uncharacterized protein dnm_007620 [Desulfonema magnum]|uniref:Uncharacterized protein n=1 Tax=Desulfonema magnum TaxID=45655 RepID=A0A975GKL4_9BACT|nr:Uncharacterized protein dnm_007620 [Desulfonema magnum]